MWKELWEQHRAKTVGVICGLLLAVIYLFFGFWDMLMFGLIVLVGFYVGQKIDAGEPVLNWEQIYRWMTDRWRLFK